MESKPQLNSVLKAAMHSHREMLTVLSSLNEDQITAMLEYELADNRPRPSVITALHQRQCILRAKRERAAMLKNLGPVRGLRREAA